MINNYLPSKENVLCVSVIAAFGLAAINLIESYRQVLKRKRELENFINAQRNIDSKYLQKVKKNDTNKNICLFGQPVFPPKFHKIIRNNNSPPFSPLQLQLKQRPEEFNYNMLRSAHGTNFYLVHNLREFHNTTKQSKVHNKTSDIVIEKTLKAVQNKKDQISYLLRTHKIMKIDMRETNIIDSVLGQKTQLVHEQTPWYRFLEFFNVRDFKYRYFETKTTLYLNPITLAVYGTIQFDELNNMFKIHSQTIAQSIAQIRTYFNQRYDRQTMNMIGWSLIVGGMSLFSYFSITTLIKNFKTYLRQRRLKPLDQSIKYLLANPKNKLICAHCNINTVQVVFQCKHLSICKKCIEECPRCPQCNLKYTRITNVYLA